MSFTGSGTGSFGRGRPTPGPGAAPPPPSLNAFGHGSRVSVPTQARSQNQWDDDDWDAPAARPSQSVPVGPGSISNELDPPAPGVNQRNYEAPSSTVGPSQPPVGIVSPTGAGVISSTGNPLASVLPIPQGPLVTSTSGPNDCEIIVLGGDQHFAEEVERDIRKLGLKVDLMFPTASISLVNFIENLRSLGTSFAVVIRPENNIRRSVTLHVLKGVAKAEEHRNMPLNTCYTKLESMIKEFRQIEFRHTPANVRANVGRLLEHSYMTDMEYLSILKYVRQQWERQRQIEERKDFDPGTGICTKEELQQRIARIIGSVETLSESSPSIS